MKKYLCLILPLLLLLTGCAAEKVSQNQDTEKIFASEIEDSSWEVDIMGVTGAIAFGDGKGTVTLNGYGTRNFEYTLSNVSEDGQSADITIENSGIDQIDGQTVRATIVEDGLEVSYWGMTYVLPPISN